VNGVSPCFTKFRRFPPFSENVDTGSTLGSVRKPHPGTAAIARSDSPSEAVLVTMLHLPRDIRPTLV
jgi:hypothetical protein